jgi:hypothetical protein
MKQYSRDWPQTELGRESVSQDMLGAPLRGLDLYYSVLAAQSVELLSKTEMEVYFPESEIIAERVLGLRKSLVAVR